MTVTALARLRLGWKQPWATCCSLCLRKPKVKDSEVLSFQDAEGHVCFGLCQMPLKALPLGSCCEPTPRGGCFSPWAPGEALGTLLVISDFSNRDFVAKKLHPWSPTCNLHQRKGGPWGLVAFAKCSSPIHRVSLRLSRSSSASCSKQVFLLITSLWTSRNPKIICHFINKLCKLSPQICLHADRCKHVQCALILRAE